MKVSVAVTAREGLVLGMRSMPGNPYDGHTVDLQLEQMEILAGAMPRITLVDRGYRRVQAASSARLLVSHTRKMPRSFKTLLKRRKSVEPLIWHMKSDGLLDKNWLKGVLADAIHAVLCVAGHNLRMILRRLRRLRALNCAWMALIAVALIAVIGIHWRDGRSRTALVTG